MAPYPNMNLLNHRAKTGRIPYMESEQFSYQGGPPASAAVRKNFRLPRFVSPQRNIFRKRKAFFTPDTSFASSTTPPWQPPLATQPFIEQSGPSRARTTSMFPEEAGPGLRRQTRGGSQMRRGTVPGRGPGRRLRMSRVTVCGRGPGGRPHMKGRGVRREGSPRGQGEAPRPRGPATHTPGSVWVGGEGGPRGRGEGPQGSGPIRKGAQGWGKPGQG